jgi:3'-phosphoadenosine 5'-phosphosulfate sulfotransferase (PAPS reductase)/FAD synthetase
LANQKYTAEDLKEMQSFSLDRKIQITQTRILEWYTKFEGKVYISFSGGKDSTVLLDLARRMYPDIEAVYIDTGLEYPELREFVKSVKNVRWLKPEMNFKQVINTYGYPLISKEVADNVYRARRGSKNAIDRMNGLNPDGTLSSFKKGNIKYKYLLDAPFEISNKCCTIMKKNPAKKYEKETGNKPIIATMACESTFRKTGWLQVGCNAFNKDRPTSQPMSFWTEQDVLQYIKKYNLNYASVYGDIVEDGKGKLYTTKCDRTGCVFCGFGCQCEKEDNRFQRLKRTHPKLWEYCMKPVSDGGLGMREVLEYIGVKIE